MLISWGFWRRGTSSDGKSQHPPRAKKINRIVCLWFSWDVSTFVKVSLPASPNLSPLPGHWSCHKAECKPAQNTSNFLRNNKKFIRRRDVFIYHTRRAPTSHQSAQSFSHARQSFFLFAVSKRQSYKVQEMILARNLMQHCTSRTSVSGLIITLQFKYLNCLKGIFDVPSPTDLIIQILSKKISSFLPFLPGLGFCSGLKVQLLLSLSISAYTSSCST